MGQTHDNNPPAPSTEPSGPPLDNHSRRDVVRQGVKLAFVAPILSTFFARDAYAAGYSCYPAGQSCDGNSKEPCCGGACNLGVCP